MNRIFAALLLLVCAAPCLATEYKLDVKGTVYGRGDRGQPPLPNVEVKAQADPLWGQASEKDLERARKKTGEAYPEIEVSGSATTDSDGFFSMQLTISVPETKKLPKASDGNNPPSWYDYVNIKFTCEVDGYRPPKGATFLYIDKENIAQKIYLEKIARVTGRLLSLDKMKPLPNTTVIVRQKLVYGRQDQDKPSWKTTTDAKGNFELKDPDGPLGLVRLELEDAALAFASNSKAWTDINIQNGDNDLGNLMVVKGCTLKLRVVESAAMKPVSIVIALYADGKALLSEPTPTGEFERNGIPEGTYLVDIVTGAYFGRKLNNQKLVPGVNDLGDIVVEPVINIEFELSVDQGQVPARSEASAILVEGTPPESARKWGAYYSYRGSAINERGFMSGMFKGRWFIEVTSNNWAPYWTEVDLPMDGKLKVKLTQGGSFEANVSGIEGQSPHIEWIAIAIPGTPAEKWLRERSREFETGNGNKAPGLLYHNGGSLATNPNAKDTATYKPGPLMPGKYLLRGKTNVGYIESEFEIKAGEHLKLDLAPEPGRIEVKVTKDGRPAPGEKLLFISTDYTKGNKEVITELKADDNGICLFEIKSPGTYTVLLEREKAWVDAVQYESQKRERLETLSGRSFYLGYGDVAKLSIDTGGRERTWLTIELDVEKGFTIQGATMTPSLQRSRNAGGGVSLSATVDGNKLSYAMLRPGNYCLRVSLLATDGRSATTVTDVRVEPKSEQTIKVKLELNEVTVTVKLPKGANEDTTSVVVVSKPGGSLAARFMAVSGKHERGKFTIGGVPPGEYDVVVTTSKSDGSYFYYGSESVTVNRNGKAKVAVDDNQGSLQVNTRGGSPGIVPNSMEATIKITLLDSNMKTVVPGMPYSGVNRFGGSTTVQGVPSGKYTVRVEGTGCKPWEGEATVEREKVTQLNVVLEAATVVRLKVAPELTAILLAEDFTLRLEDHDGTQIGAGKVDTSALFVEVNERGESTFFITTLSSNTKRLRVRLKGYKEAVFEVDVSDGATFDAELKPEPE